jgi:hypothetical protein
MAESIDPMSELAPALAVGRHAPSTETDHPFYAYSRSSSSIAIFKGCKKSNVSESQSSPSPDIL